MIGKLTCKLPFNILCPCVNSKVGQSALNMLWMFGGTTTGNSQQHVGRHGMLWYEFVPCYDRNMQCNTVNRGSDAVPGFDIRPGYLK